MGYYDANVKTNSDLFFNDDTAISSIKSVTPIAVNTHTHTGVVYDDSSIHYDPTNCISSCIPFRTVDANSKRMIMYNAMGISGNNIKYHTEFVNRNGETYLNVKGYEKKVVNRELPCGKTEEVILYENEIHIHMKVDTDIYDEYEVNVCNGVLIITLHEVLKRVPKFSDVTNGKSLPTF